MLDFRIFGSFLGSDINSLACFKISFDWPVTIIYIIHRKRS